MSHLLHVEIPNFGSSLLESLNEQRMQDHYCDVAVMVNDQNFKAHRAVLATSSLYFRDLFSGSSQNMFELPSLVTPTCFQQILSFCYTGKLTMAASEQLVLMYMSGYLQIQNIVEHGMDLMLKANSPHCDSQTATTEDLGFEPLSPNINHPDLLPLYPLASGEHSSPRPSNLPATNSPTSHPNEEEFEEELCGSRNTNGAYGQIYGHPTNSYSMQDKLDVFSLLLATQRRPFVLIGRDKMALPANLLSQIGYHCHPTLYMEGDPGEKLASRTQVKI
nr:nucleus accumbens-associated protein 2-like [Salvelinus alpinus]